MKRISISNSKKEKDKDNSFRLMSSRIAFKKTMIRFIRKINAENLSEVLNVLSE